MKFHENYAWKYVESCNSAANKSPMSIQFRLSRIHLIPTTAMIKTYGKDI